VFAGRGATINWLLEKNFCGGFHQSQAPETRGVISNEEIVDFVMRHPEAQALASHHFQPPFPTHDTLRFVELCLLRHPLDRLQTMYYIYNRINDPEVASSVKAQELGLRDWLAWQMEGDPYYAFNHQTAFWGGVGPWAFPPSQAQLERAKARLQNATLLGVMERFDETLASAEYFLRARFPTLDLSYVLQNPSERWEGTLEERLERMRDECGAAFYDDLRRCNALDEELWEWASAELERRWSYVPRPKIKLHAFQARCAEHPRKLDALQMSGANGEPARWSLGSIRRATVERAAQG
jgi:hypothetical protein